MTAPSVASSAAAYAALDAAYRAATARTAANVIRILAARWRLIVPTRLADTSQVWLDDAVEAVLAGQRTAAAMADAYAERVRSLSVPDARPFTPPPPRAPNPEQIRKSLEFTGIRTTAREIARVDSVRQAAPDEEIDSASRTAEGRTQQLLNEGLQRAAGATIRHITTAGRDQLEDIVCADSVAIGWARTTKAGSCYFCAMLASRGYVYKEESFRESNARFQGVGEQKVHDNCGCGLRPIYSPVDPLPDRMEALEQMWVDMTRETGFGGKQAINEFRRRYELSELAVRAS